ncbi:hypothetical protein ACWGBY_10465 [Streptomyces griseus]|uniref:hypothetical protein n=1 Tax=Streptomyces TaxID=1883 RepID=UPI0029CA8282|nr:hypothetical protein [Streptomyces sp. ID01-9D]WSV25841.1 hypothetical protein OG554_38095 [Streptomyces fimicarius]WTC85229.1 hypothetical protein OH733_00090 [Streptomyces griseus]WTD72153.1 hypothetical protein OH763_36895 [Streptomyces griseus]
MTQNVVAAGKPRRMLAGGCETARGISFPVARGQLWALPVTGRALSGGERR